jgi:hypothetical protein
MCGMRFSCGDYEDYPLLGSDIVFSGNKCFKGHLYTKDVESGLLRNAGNYHQDTSHHIPEVYIYFYQMK